VKRRVGNQALLGSLLGWFMVAVLVTISWTQEAPPAPHGAKVGGQVSAFSLLPAARAEPKTDYELLPGEDPQNHLFRPFVEHLVKDQENFWSAPTRIRRVDLKWVTPLAAVTGGLIAGDHWISQQVPDKPNQLQRSLKVSNYGMYSLAGVAGASFLWGELKKNEHLSETGLLAGEATINALAVASVLSAVTQRPRPLEGNGHGALFHRGNSFPSDHSAIAWSVASVFAHEYPGPLTKLSAYGLASAVTMARITSKEHFASDAVIGGLLGFYFGHEVYRAHHDPELGGAAWGNFIESDDKPRFRTPANTGSPYVPLDSWIYPALDRLIALGYIKTAYLGIRPWTRMQCAQMLEEAEQQIGDEDNRAGNGRRIYRELAQELSDENARLSGAANTGVSLDSVYTRATNITGTPLRDGYHFGQTIINDYGRPYGQGFNSVDGLTAHAEAGRFAFYIRGEYQHAPAVVSHPPGVLQAIANADFTTPVPDGRAEVNRLDLVEGAVSVNLSNVQLSFGKQSQWLGTGESGSLLMSNNAEPVLTFKLNSILPYRVPLLSSILGPVQSEYFLGQLGGHQFELNGNQLLGPGNITPQPFLQGGKFSFKPTPNLEIGMGFTAQFAGPGLPLTFRNFLRTFYFHSQTGPTSSGNNPAKRATTLDFSYRVPGLRNWLTVYSDALTVDELSPIGSSRATVNPGIYMPQFPKLHNLELRAEGIHEPLTNEFAPGFVYYGLRRYRSGYTNDGNLLGNWVGRAGRGGQAWLTYSFSPRTRLQFQYRLQEVSHKFIEGGRLGDYAALADFALSPKLSLSGSLQYEQWRFPVLSPARQSNITASVQLTFHPHWRLTK